MAIKAILTTTSMPKIKGKYSFSKDKSTVAARIPANIPDNTAITARTTAYLIGFLILLPP
jgi:hypothetical protein